MTALYRQVIYALRQTSEHVLDIAGAIELAPQVAILEFLEPGATVKETAAFPRFSSAF